MSQAHLDTMALAELDSTDHQTAPNNSQNATSTKVTLELRKYILLLATLVATVTYGPGFSPPGDVWKDTADGHFAGEVIIDNTHHKRYLAFFYCNATAFATSFVVIVIALTITCLDDYKDKYSGSNIVIQYMKRQWIAIRTLQLAMVLDLLSLMGAYAAGTCQDTFTTIYSSVLGGLVFLYLVIQMAVAARTVEEAPQLPDENAAVASVASSSGGVPEQDKANNHFRKDLMLLATFAVSITYLAGLSSPGGFWDSAGAGHRPGDAILKDHHSTRLAVFFSFNTLAFVTSLLIIVVLLDAKPHHHLRHGFIVVTLLSLIVAYNAGSCRQTDTTVYVFCLIGAVLLCILLLLWVTRSFSLEEPQTPSTRPGVPQAQHANGRESKTEKAKAEDKARSVLLLATLAATITYQAGLDPPGGVWQDDGDDHFAGDPMLLTTDHRRYNAFFYCNSASLVASLIAIVLVQEKRLLNHHVLEAVIILDLFGLIGAYAAGSCWDVKTSIYAMAFAGAVLVYVVIHVIFITLVNHTRTRRESDKENDNELVEKKRKRLLHFAILAATITYQAGLTPPEGFLLKDDQTGHHAGDPVLVIFFPRRYKVFVCCNSVSFMLSIALILILVNPKLYRPAIRTHALSVCTAVGVFSLMGAYAAGSNQYFITFIYIFAWVGVLGFFIILLFLVFSFAGCSKTNATSGTSQGQATETGRTQDNREEDKHIKKKKVHAKRKYLMLLGILVASVTYQAGLEPPGGAWSSNSGGYEAGNPVMHDNRRPRYLVFFYSNSTSFMASIVVILLLMVPENLLVRNDDQLVRDDKWLKRWLVVMNTTIVLDLLGLLGAYAAGSSRQWKTSVYVLLLVIAVLAYMAFHLLLARIIRNRKDQRAKSRANDTP